MTPSNPESVVIDNFARRVLKNAGAMLGSEIFSRVGVFAAYILVARRFGTESFAELSLGLGFFLTVRTVATAGMQTLLTREVSKNKDSASSLLTHGGVIVLVLGLLSEAVGSAAAYLLDYPAAIQYAIFVLGLGTVPFAVGVVCDSVLQGLEKMHFITAASAASNAVALLGILVVALLGGPFEWILWILTATQVLALVIKLGALATAGGVHTSSVHWETLVSVFHGGIPFAGIRILQAVGSSLVLVLVSKLVSETAAGVFNAAMQVMNPIGLLMENTMLGALPVLAGTVNRIEAVVHHSKRILATLLALAIPASVGLFFVSDSLLGLFYGKDKFHDATPIVQVVCWVLVLRVLTQVFGQFLVVNGRERRTVRILLINTIVLACAAPVLVYAYGLVGAGFSVLLLRAVDTFQHYWAVRSDYRWTEVVNVAWAPAVASAVMATALIVDFDDNLFFRIGLGAFCYALSLGMMLWMNGTLAEVRASS